MRERERERERGRQKGSENSHSIANYRWYLRHFVVSLGESSETQDDDALIPLRDDDLDDAFALEAEQKTEKKFMSIILTNLHVNYEGWRAELPQEEVKEGEGERKALEDGTGEEKEGDIADEERVSALHACMHMQQR